MLARFLPYAALLVSIAMPAFGQRQDGQLWLQVNTNVPIAHDVRLTIEQIARFSDRADGLYQTEFGGLLGWRVADGVELGFGYRKVGAHNSGTADEDRLRQQVVMSSGRFVTRLRVDERFHPRGSEIGFRVRPLVRYDHPIGSRGTALFLSHESFFLPNSTGWGQRSGFERMRNVAGVTLPVARGIGADIGYLNQFRFSRDGARAQMDHALTVQVTISLADVRASSAHD